MKQCIALAYGLAEDKDYSISGPKWLSEDRYDVTAKFPPDSRIDQVRTMFQAFLAERFGMQTHMETKEVPVYALVVARSSSKLQALERRGSFLCPRRRRLRFRSTSASTSSPPPLVSEVLLPLPVHSCLEPLGLL